jgi:FkbM family methyltransferase
LADRLIVRQIPVLGGVYRSAAEGCAEALYRAPWTEAAFVHLSRRWWNVPAVGRFMRSVSYRLAERLFDSGCGIREIVLGGVPLHLDVGEWTTTGHYFANVTYEPATVRYLQTHLAEGDVFVDVGANSGYFTLIAAGLVGPRGRVVAFEPNPAVRERLELNVARNGFQDRADIATCALSDQTAVDVPLFVPEHDGFATLVPTLAPAASYVSSAGAIRIRTCPFDDWLAATAIDTVALMKIDVEGAEAQVLAGMRASLAAGRIRRLVLETAWEGPSHQQLVACGFTPECLESVGPLDNIAYTTKR